MVLSEWAEKYFVLPKTQAVSGLIRLHGWQKAIVDSFTDPRVLDITLKVSTQMIKTLFIQLATAYVIAEAPGPILISQYKDSDAEQFSKERLAPMLRDCPILHGLISEPFKRGSANTTTYKEFPGGSLSLVGSRRGRQRSPPNHPVLLW